MQFKNIPQDIRHAIIVSMILSVVIGGLVGGGVGFFVSAWANNSINGIMHGIFGDSVAQVGTQTQSQNLQPVIESSATIDAVTRATPAVVSIVITQDLSAIYSQHGFDPFQQFFFGTPFGYQEPQTGKQEVGGGSGFIVTTDGLIVTNRHVVDRDNAEYSVVMNDGTRYDAQVLAIDTLNDIAILKIDADNLPILDLGDSDAIQIGQTVIAIGNSLGEFNNTVTKGVISGINRRVVAGDGFGYSETIEEAIQTDAAINPGNSGGPLIDLFGKVIGVNTAVSQSGQLIGFSIPINEVKNVIESVQKHGRIVRPFLGVRYILLTEEIAKANNIVDINYGALVVRGEARTDVAVAPGSPADKAGIVENDIILSINNEKITNDKGLSRVISQYQPGDMITLEIYHRGDSVEKNVTLTERIGE